MILYWIFASLVALSLVSVPPEYMYSDYSNPTVVSWNWSFFPLDVAFATAGLYGRFAAKSVASQDFLATFSLSLMFCAGLMAISFWIIDGSFDPFWWAINLWLLVLASTVLLQRYRSQNGG